MSVAYAAGDDTGAPGTTNVVKPLYHVAWLAARLGLRVVSPLAPVEPKGKAAAPVRLRPGEKAPLHRGLGARLTGRSGTGEIGVVIRPIASPMPPGTTLRVELLAERRGSELRADVTAEAENVHVHTWLDGVQAIDRTFKAPRRTDVDLLGEALESGGRDPVSVGHDPDGRGRSPGRSPDVSGAGRCPRSASSPRTRSRRPPPRRSPTRWPAPSPPAGSRTGRRPAAPRRPGSTGRC